MNSILLNVENIDIDILKKINIKYSDNSYIIKNNDDECYLTNILYTIKNLIKDKNICFNSEFLNDDDYIEVWFKTSTKTFNWHFDCNEEIKKNSGKIINPKLSCILYLDNNNAKTTILNINNDEYRYKQFNKENIDIDIITPSESNLLIFNSRLLHCCIDYEILQNEVHNRNIIVFNIWSKDEKINHNIFSDKSNKFFTKNNINIKEIETYTNYLSDNKEISEYNIYNFIINNIIPEYINKKINEEKKQKIRIVYDKNINIEKKINEIGKHRYIKRNEIITDINNMKKINIYNNRFSQRFKYNNFIYNSTCDWLLDEVIYNSEKIGWDKSRHINYPSTDIKTDKIKSVHNYIITHFRDIGLQIKESYCLPDNIELNVIDSFIAKYEIGNQTFLELHKDGSDITVNICLNNGFQGGGVYFEDGISIQMNKGDMIIHSGKCMHAGIPITIGTRYILVLFINIS